MLLSSFMAMKPADRWEWARKTPAHTLYEMYQNAQDFELEARTCLIKREVDMMLRKGAPLSYEEFEEENRGFIIWKEGLNIAVEELHEMYEAKSYQEEYLSKHFRDWELEEAERQTAA